MMIDFNSFPWTSLHGEMLSTSADLQSFSQHILIEEQLNAQLIEQELKSSISIMRFNETATDEDILDWIRFWHKQFLEHCALLNVLLNSNPAQSKPLAQNPLWSQLPENQPQLSYEEMKDVAIAGQVAPKLRQVFDVLVLGWREFEMGLTRNYAQRTVNVAHLHALCKWTLGAKNAAYDAIKSGLWIGSAYSNLIVHMVEELWMFILRLSGQVNATQLIVFFTNIIADHISTTGHLMDPAGPPQHRRQVLQQLQLAEDGYVALEQGNVSLDVCVDYIRFASKEYAKAVPSILSQDIPNIVNPVDAVHAQRENDWAVAQLAKLDLSFIG